MMRRRVEYEHQIELCSRHDGMIFNVALDQVLVSVQIAALIIQRQQLLRRRADYLFSISVDRLSARALNVLVEFG